MSRKPPPTTAARKPVSSGRSPIIPARGVAMRESEDNPHPVAEPTPAAPVRANLDPQMPVESFAGYGRPANAWDAAKGTWDGEATELSDTLARAHARDRVEIPTNPKLEQARADLDAAVAAKALTNWEMAMVESLIDLRDLQDVIDAMTAKQAIIRENVKLALAGSEAKTFKFNLGAATLAKGAETVTIVDEKKLPYEYMHSVPDKTKIGRALKVPIDVAGAKLTEGAPSLRISWED
jgi:hypothetical protein